MLHGLPKISNQQDGLIVGREKISAQGHKKLGSGVRKLDRSGFRKHQYFFVLSGVFNVPLDVSLFRAIDYTDTE